MPRYTGYIRFNRIDVEEIDVDAATEAEARRMIEAELQSDYEPGGRIERVVERFGLYL